MILRRQLLVHMALQLTNTGVLKTQTRLAFIFVQTYTVLLNLDSLVVDRLNACLSNEMRLVKLITESACSWAALLSWRMWNEVLQNQMPISALLSWRMYTWVRCTQNIIYMLKTTKNIVLKLQCQRLRAAKDYSRYTIRYSFLLCLFSYSLVVGSHTASKYICLHSCAQS